MMAGRKPINGVSDERAEMFGFGKKKIKIKKLVDDLIVIMYKWRLDIHKKAKETGLSELRQYPIELNAFVFSIGDMAVQISDLTLEDKQKISANLMVDWTKEIRGWRRVWWWHKTKITETLLTRSIDYRAVLEVGGNKTMAGEMVSMFFRLLDRSEDKHTEVALALMVCGCIGITEDITNYLNNISKTHRLG